MVSLPRLLIVLGFTLVAVGLLWPYLTPLVQKLGLGRLPGDIMIEGKNSRFYFPVTTSILISLVLSLLFWLFRK